MTDMSECARKIKWAGGEHIFDLSAEHVRKVFAGDIGSIPIALVFHGYDSVRKVGALPGQYGDTPSACLKRFEQAVYSHSDVERILELALWGGGMHSTEVVEISNKHIRGKPLNPLAEIAVEVLAALFVGAANVSASA